MAVLMTSAPIDYEAMDQETFQAYAAVVEVLYGDGAHELIAKASADLSSAQKRERREETARKIAFVNSAVGAAAGPAAIAGAVRAAKKGEGGSPRAAMRRFSSRPGRLQPLRNRAGRMVNYLDAAGRGAIKTPKGKLAALGVGTSLVGLQVGALAGDTITAHFTAKKKSDVHKSSPDQADMHVPGSGGSKRRYTTGTLTLMALEKGTPVAAKGVKKTGELTVRGARAAEPIVVDTSRKIASKTTEKVRKDGHDVTWEGEFSKFDTDKRQVFGWASIVEVDGKPVVDLQGDYITPDEIEKAAYTYVQKSRKGGDMHRRDGSDPVHVSDMIESFMVTPEKKKAMGLPDSVPTGWWVGFQVNDEDTWDLVKKNKRTGFSIHGRGKRVPVEGAA